MNCIEMMALVDLCGPLAVVPVFVNTGAALLPALIAGLASFVTILFKPKLLIRTCWEKPYWPIGIAVVGIGCWLAVTWFSSAPPEENPPVAVAQEKLMTPYDWVKLARKLEKSKSRPLVTSPLPEPEEKTPAEELPSGESPMILAGGNTRSGFLGGPSPIDLEMVWDFTEYGAMFLSSPFVHDNRVYGAYCVLDPPGSYGAVMCLDAANGEVVWLTDLKNPTDDFKGFFSSPAITPDSKTIVIGQGLHPDYDSELVCLDAETGSVKWLFECPLHIESSPTISGDIVVVGAGAVEDPSTHKPKSHSDPDKNENPGYVFAVKISTGELLWRHVLNDPESSPAVEDGVVYIGSGFNGKAVAALRLEGSDAELKEKGVQREIWKTSTPFPATGAITLVGDLVIVGCGNGDYVFQDPEPAGAVLGLDKKTGKVLWKLSMPDGVLGPIAVHSGRMVVPVRNGEIVALKMPDGTKQPEVLWRKNPREGARVLAGCALTEENVYAVTHDGFMLVLDAASGDLVESHYINASPGEMGMSIASPLVTGGCVYVGSETGGLRCYGEKNDGK